MRVGGCESGHIAFDKNDPRLIYSGCYLGQIEEFDRATQTTRDVRVYPELEFGTPQKERKYRFNWNAPILVSRHNPKVIYHAGNVIVRSTDRGHSWEPISPDLSKDEEDKQGAGGFPITNEVSENYNTVSALAGSPFSAGRLWAGTDDGLVHITDNGGRDWAEITPGRAGDGLVNAIEPSPHDADTAYLAFSRYKYDDHRPLIFKTSDAGRRWKNIAEGIPAGHWVRAVREDPQIPGLLYAGTEMGLYVSFDDGGAWQPLDAGDLPVVPVTDIVVKERGLVISTQGRAFWILDDLSALRAMAAVDDAEDIQAAQAHLFAPAEALYVDVEGGSYAGKSDNPPVAALLYYTLNAEPALEEAPLTIEILSEEGDVIRTLSTDADKGAEGGGRGSAYALPAKRGLNRGRWDFRTEPIEPSLGEFAIAGGPDKIVDGYNAGPGAYIVRLTFGETVIERPLTVRFDPGQDYDAADLAEQQRLVADAAAMLEEFHHSVTALRKVREQAELRASLADEGGLDDLADAAEAVAKAVTDWEEGLISTEREFFQDVLNWPDKLFADLQMLYGTLDDALPRASQGITDRFGDLKAVFTDAMAARDAIVETEITAFNRRFREAGAEGLAVPAFAARD